MYCTPEGPSSVVVYGMGPPMSRIPSAFLFEFSGRPCFRSSYSPRIDLVFMWFLRRELLKTVVGGHLSSGR